MARLLVQNALLDSAVPSCQLASLRLVLGALFLVQKVNILMALPASHAVVILGVRLVLFRLISSILVIAAKLDTTSMAPPVKSVLSTLTR